MHYNPLKPRQRLAARAGQGKVVNHRQAVEVYLLKRNGAGREAWPLARLW